MKNVLITWSCLLCLINVSYAQDNQTPIKDSEDRINYSLGYQIGTDLMKQGMEINPAAVLQGLEDGSKGSEPQLSQPEMDRILQDLKREIVDQQRTPSREARRNFRLQAQEFFAKNANKKGVVDLPSGLQYRVIKKGQGKKPGPHDLVRVRYSSELLSRYNPDVNLGEKVEKEMQVDETINGLTEALQLMQEGDHWEIFIPSHLAYGRKGPLADQSVIFDLELISVKTVKQ